ncbi:hypothetical protein [Microbacterium sp. 18062]|uniref:hypothetical protein n=1 Tax=Microbacterium sp. 18062 TaxID=2681410 RepID=UPI00135BAB14|nr:hypothetical protein [Microbacterium sp. 18062]
MPYAPGFPTDFTEYVLVWCADLLEPLDVGERRLLLDGLTLMYTGGPWPDRLQIQRLVEQMDGRYDPESFIGELEIRSGGGIAGAVDRLRDPRLREYALSELRRYPGTPGLVVAVNAQVDAGVLSEQERNDILTSAINAPVLPGPIPAPEGCPPLPEDHPESFEDLRARRMRMRPDRGRPVAGASGARDREGRER